ncbi:MAG: DUF1015 family protein [Candidatus Hydrogenedens sp.]
MPLVRGLRALRYNDNKINDFSNVITPPYDIITPEIREDLAKRSEYNFVHIDLPVENSHKTKYEKANELFQEWQNKNILIREVEVSAYWLRQRFTDIRGIQMERLTLLALTKIPEEQEGNSQILPHERTFNKPVEDRMALLSATNAQLSPIFFIFSDKEKALQQFFIKYVKDAGKYPDISVVTIDGVLNELWQTKWNDELTDLFENKTLYIADGHHRFQTAKKILEEKKNNLSVNKENEIEPYRYVLTGFVAFEDPGLIIYAPHRVINNVPDINYEQFFKYLNEYFKITQVENNPVEYIMQKQKECENNNRKYFHCFGLVVKNRGRFLIELNDKGYKRVTEEKGTHALHDVNVYILHKLIFEEIMKLEPNTQLLYETNPFRCIEMVEKEKAEMTFLINPICPEVIKKCADNGEFMPQKATYFFPKIPSGLVIYELTRESLQ